MKYIIGIDIGGTAIKYALFDKGGTLYDSGNIKTSSSGSAILNDLTLIVMRYKDKYEIEGVGVSTPGTPDNEGNMILGGAVKDFYQFPLQRKLEERISLPLAIENDANCVALAEQWMGYGHLYHDFLCITFGTGVGGALVLENKLYKGSQNMAGEFGLMLIKTINKESDALYSSYNYYGSIPYGLMRLYEFYAKTKAENGKEIYDLKEININAKSAIDEYTNAISIGLLNLTAILNPQAILLGGSISSNEKFIIDVKIAFERLWKSHGHISHRAMPKIMACSYTNLAGCYGAAYKILCKLEKEYGRSNV